MQILGHAKLRSATDGGERKVRHPDYRAFALAPENLIRKTSPQPTMADFWVKMGWYKTLKGGAIKLTYADWCMGEGIRKDAVRFLVEKVLRKNPRDMSAMDFHSNRLCGLLTHYYNGSTYAALKEAGYDLHPWELSCAPMSFYKSKENRKAAIIWLVHLINKDPRDLIQTDFHSNCLCGLLTVYYRDSPYAALKEAGYSIHPWEMSVTPQRFYKSKKNRIAAIKWLVKKLGKTPHDITKDDFHSNRLCGLLSGNYDDSPYAALLEAGIVTKKDAAYMRSSHHTHGDSR